MITILGGKGYFATAFAKELRREGMDFRILSRADGDYTDRAILRRLLLEERPEFLVNAAGFTGMPNVDSCETAKAECLMGNAVFPGYVREVCDDLMLPWGHLSSGCIYSGERPGGGGFTEEDEPNFSFRRPPCSFYSGTKALGEEVLEGSDHCYVWRIRIPFNNQRCRRNYLQKLVDYDKLLDATNSVSHLDESVAAMLACWRERVPFGIYNVTNPGAITTRQVTGWMLEESDRRRSEGLENPFEKEYQFFDSEEDFMTRAAVAPRSNCVLDPSKLLATGIRLRPVEEAVKAALREWEGAERAIAVP